MRFLMMGFSLTDRWCWYPLKISRWFTESPTRWMLAPITKVMMLTYTMDLGRVLGDLSMSCRHRERRRRRRSSRDVAAPALAGFWDFFFFSPRALRNSSTKIPKYPELEWTQKNHLVQLLSELI